MKDRITLVLGLAVGCGRGRGVEDFPVGGAGADASRRADFLTLRPKCKMKKKKKKCEKKVKAIAGGLLQKKRKKKDKTKRNGVRQSLT